MDSKWASVTDQSGIFAGKGGFDIKVGNNTDLKGAVISSEAEDTNKNRLDTGTISFSDIKNKAEFNVSHISVSGGTGGAGAPAAYQNSEKDSSITHSAVEQGQLIIRNKNKQQQDINDLSRDTENANHTLKPIFDKQKELDKIETVELIKDIAQQTKSIMGKYDRIQAQKDVDKDKEKLSRAEAEKAYKELSDKERAQIDFEKYYENNKDYWYYVAVDTQLQANQATKNLGTMGGDVSKGIDSAASIITGIIAGDITGGLAGASAPWLAEQIKIHAGDNEVARLTAHAILGAVVAELQGNSGLAGSAGAVSGELAAEVIIKQLYDGKDIKDLTEAEKQNISALSQLAAGLAAASVGGDVGDMGASIAASKNAVENNYLNSSDHQDKVGLEYKEKEGLLTEDEKQKLVELRIKDESSTNALLEACVDVNSEGCHIERQKAYDALRTYVNYYYNKLEHQNGYLEIKQLLDGTSNTPEANQLRAIYQGYLESYKRFGYSDEQARVMAGRTMGSMIMLHGLTETITLPKINKIFGGSKLLQVGKAKENRRLDKEALEEKYGKGNVQQGGGNYKEIKDKIYDGQAENAKANESSNFGEHVKKEKEVNAGKRMNEKVVHNLPTTKDELHADLKSKGFTSNGQSQGGYETWKGPEGVTVTIKPSGEVIRTQRVCVNTPNLVHNSRRKSCCLF
ncbi:VENN motif pre-toxin domain-containing protein [Gilliamella sp. WF3-4]|uniref:VENN motif pre-toxin domain-containing protein n=1 Tax=Gilliamella sp. WF3-4 TaxID=3120255 RepID=UPI002FF9B66D